MLRLDLREKCIVAIMTMPHRLNLGQSWVMFASGTSSCNHELQF